MWNTCFIQINRFVQFSFLLLSYLLILSYVVQYPFSSTSLFFITILFSCSLTLGSGKQSLCLKNKKEKGKKTQKVEKLVLSGVG